MEEVDQLEKLEDVLEVNAKDIEEKKIYFSKLQEEIRKVNSELPERTVFMANIAANADGIKLDEKTVFDYIKEDNKLYGKWVNKECKKRALEECVMQLKKAYQEKSIGIQELLELSRPLYFKQFKCIHTIARIQRLLCPNNNMEYN
eukprot:TRINITY_DN8742_c0_g1_i1.p1 TRINITY_DN8742_c0_g1~~TRINITY_DN8742_c0_g1_i1.p1  ORF type:complete len:146 (+),score=77.68 TRINITY_DN8742_c0_g1_i1:1074-1511(+)